MEKQQKKRMKKIICWGLIVVLVALLAVMPLLTSDNETVDGPQASILSGIVGRSDIATRLVGGGTLTSEKAVEIRIPEAVKLTEYLVGNGDTVEEGDVIATVDRVSVMTAITGVQETIDSLVEEIQDISDEKASATVTAQAGGTVKIIYAEAGESVEDVMLRDGALAVLSLDGLMAVQVACDTGLSAGDTLLVTLPDGAEVTGRVESNLEGVLTVTMDDDGYAVGEEVTLVSREGDTVGSGELYIHSRWNATAYSGTVSAIRVSEGDSVSAGRTLMTLENTGHTAEYQKLVNQHQEYEALMLELFEMYQTEAVTAPCAGVVTGVDEDGVYMLSDDGTGWQITLLTNAPNGDDETAYVNYIGQVTSVGIDGLVLKMNPRQLSITDYLDLSGVPTDTALMTEDVVYAAQAPVYELSGGQWVQIEASAIAEGDILLFAGDVEGSFVWVVRVAKGNVTPDSPEEPTESVPNDPTEPSEPDQPADSAEPTAPATPGESATPGQSGGSFPQSGGSFSGIGGGTVQEEAEDERYSLEMLTVASVTSQAEMTLEITIDELDITKLSVGQAADVTVDALAGQTFPATITRIANSGESDGGNSKFTVTLTLDKSGDMLPGMNASAFITLGTVSDTVAIPVAALVENGNKTILYTSYDAESGELGGPITVMLGASDGENVQILSGVEAGTVYYYAYYDTLEISDTPEIGGFRFNFGAGR